MLIGKSRPGAGQEAFPAWITGSDGADVAVTRSGFTGINDERAEYLRTLAARAVRLEELSNARRELLRIDPLREPQRFDTALAALAAIEAA